MLLVTGRRPGTLVNYDAALQDVLDRRRFALELHSLAAKTVDGITVESCKTRFRCADEAVIAHGKPGQALIHVEFELGRPALQPVELRFQPRGLSLSRSVCRAGAYIRALMVPRVSPALLTSAWAIS